MQSIRRETWTTLARLSYVYVVEIKENVPSQYLTGDIHIYQRRGKFFIKLFHAARNHRESPASRLDTR